MNFKEEHLPILEKHQHHWDGLRNVGVMRNLDAPVKQELQAVYNEAVGPERFTPWCGDCMCEMVRLLYTSFEKWKQTQQATGETPSPDPGAAGQPEKEKGKRGRPSKTETDGN